MATRKFRKGKTDLQLEPLLLFAFLLLLLLRASLSFFLLAHPLLLLCVAQALRPLASQERSHQCLQPQHAPQHPLSSTRQEIVKINKLNS